MKKFNQPKAKLMGVVVGLPLVLWGCHTVEGVGTDISHAGHALEHASEDARQPCTPTEPCPPVMNRTHVQTTRVQTRTQTY